MKRKEARQFLDGITDEVDNFAAICFSNGRVIECEGVKVGLIAGLYFARRTLENDVPRLEPSEEIAARLFSGTANVYANIKGEDKCSSK